VTTAARSSASGPSAEVDDTPMSITLPCRTAAVDVAARRT
jgi:hypothetical protein